MAKKKNPAAVELGRKGGKARASRLTPQERQDSARRAVQKRWAAFQSHAERRVHDARRYAEGVMTDEVTQLAHGRVEREFEEYNTLHETEIEKLLVSFGAEVQRQTAEAAASWLVARGEYLLAAKLREEMLSPAQEVRNG